MQYLLSSDFDRHEMATLTAGVAPEHRPAAQTWLMNSLGGKASTLLTDEDLDAMMFSVSRGTSEAMMRFQPQLYRFNLGGSLLEIDLPVGSQTLQISTGILCLKTFDEQGLLLHELRIDPTFYEPDLSAIQDILAFVGEPHLEGNEALIPLNAGEVSLSLDEETGSMQIKISRAIDDIHSVSRVNLIPREPQQYLQRDNRLALLRLVVRNH